MQAPEFGRTVLIELNLANNFTTQVNLTAPIKSNAGKLFLKVASTENLPLKVEGLNMILYEIQIVNNVNTVVKSNVLYSHPNVCYPVLESEIRSFKVSAINTSSQVQIITILFQFFDSPPIPI